MLIKSDWRQKCICLVFVKKIEDEIKMKILWELYERSTRDMRGKMRGKMRRNMPGMRQRALRKRRTQKEK